MRISLIRGGQSAYCACAARTMPYSAAPPTVASPESAESTRLPAGRGQAAVGSREALDAGWAGAAPGRELCIQHLGRRRPLRDACTACAGAAASSTGGAQPAAVQVRTRQATALTHAAGDEEHAGGVVLAHRRQHVLGKREVAARKVGNHAAELLVALLRQHACGPPGAEPGCLSV